MYVCVALRYPTYNSTTISFAGGRMVEEEGEGLAEVALWPALCYYVQTKSVREASFMSKLLFYLVCA